ncbi:MAG: hypothetical protein ACFCUN_01280 [Hyphomicrobiaceae bacterium]
MSSTRRHEAEPSGFALPYAKGKGTFRVYLAAGLAVLFGAIALETGNEIALVVTVGFLLATYYSYPLIERERARIGANEYGVFIEGFGIVAWRSIAGIRLATRFVRSIAITELEIELNRPIRSAILADWRRLPVWRLLMRLPWRMPDDRTILVDLEPFTDEPEQLLAEFVRRRSYYG